jgi:hypothetical protein
MNNHSLVVHVHRSERIWAKVTDNDFTVGEPSIQCFCEEVKILLLALPCLPGVSPVPFKFQSFLHMHLGGVYLLGLDILPGGAKVFMNEP